MQIKWRWCTHWAIPLFNYTDGVQGAIGNMSRGGGGGGLEGIIEAGPGGGGGTT